MPFQLTVPVTRGPALDIDLDFGQILFVLGANGTGKSGLLQRFYIANVAAGLRLSAHRQNWFEADTLAVTAAHRQQLSQSIQMWDRQPVARWSDGYSMQRTQVALYDLVDAENVRARSIAKAVDEADLALAQELASREAPIKTINELLRLSSMEIEVALEGNDRVIASKAGGPPYGVNKLSDGERNAILITTNVLTAKPGTLFLIDEPERHLHRSIISPLLTLLFERRQDCAFCVATHEIMLPLSNSRARTLLLRSCGFNADAASVWDADILPAEAPIDERVKYEILGARRKILFVEGTSDSLDKPLYSLVFPDVSITPKASSIEVQRTVLGIRSAADLHWIRAFGIIDNDGRDDDDIARLRASGVYPLSVFAVESIYYHPEIQRLVSERHAAVVGGNPPARIAAAKASSLAEIARHAQRLSERVAEKRIRDSVLRQLPGRDRIAEGKPIRFEIDTPAQIAQERQRIQAFIDAGDIGSIVSRYPVRETGALATIATQLDFRDRTQYEATVRKLLMDDPDALAFVRGLFGTLAADIAAAG